MTSTASAKSSSKLLTAFFKVFRERLVNSFLAAAACMGATCIMLASELKSLPENYDISDSVVMLFGVITIFTGIYSLSNAGRMFREIYKKQSCDFFFSIPISRTEYYCAGYFYGALVNLFCYLSCGALAIGVSGAAGCTFRADALLPMTSMVLSLMAIYSAFVMCAVISGKRIQYVLLSLICLLCSSSFVAGVVTEINSIWGCCISSKPLSFISPVENAVYSVFDEGKLAAHMAISIAEIVGMFIAGLIAFRRRRAESAEVEVSAEVIPCILLALLQGVSYFEFAVSNGIIGIMLGIAAMVVVTILFSKIFFRKAIVRKSLVTLAVVGAFALALSCAVNTGMLNKYVLYVPEAEEVQSVEIRINDDYALMSEAGIVGIMSSLEKESGLDDGKFVLREKENIQRVIDLHERSVSPEVMPTQKKRGNISVIRMLYLPETIDYDYSGESYRIEYTLKNGKKVSRYYVVNTALIRDYLVPVAQNEEAVDFVLNREINFDSDFLIARFERSGDEDNDYASEITDLNSKHFNVADFKEAYKKDLLECEPSQFAQTRLGMDYDDSYYGRDTIEIYYINKELSSYTPEAEQRLRNMDDASISYYLSNSYYSDDEKYPISNYYTVVYRNMQNTINYINSCK